MKKNSFRRGMVLVSILFSTLVWAQVDVSPFLENSRVFNPVDYGADPTGTSDSAPAFNAMIADIGADRHVEVFIPPGQFLLNSRVEFLPGGNTSQYGLSIRGGGQDATEIHVDNNAGGFLFSGMTMSWVSVHVSDLSFVAMRTNIAAAFEFEVADAGDPLCRNLNVENVYITSPIHTSPNFFTAGLKVRNAWDARFVNITIRKQGVYADPVRHPEFGIHLEDCRTPIIRDCHINKVQTAVYHGKNNSVARGGIFVNSYFVDVDTGIDLRLRTVGEGWPMPKLHIDNCHINSFVCGINVAGVRQMNISHVLFYCSESGGSNWFNNGTPNPAYNPVDINLAYAANITIDHCLFVEPSTPKRRAIQISADSGYVLMDGNQFNMEGTAIHNDSPNTVSSINGVFGGMKGDFSGGGAWLTRYADSTGTMVIDDLN